MQNKKGNAYIAPLSGLITFFGLGALVFFFVDRLFSNSSDEITIPATGMSLDIHDAFWGVGVFTSFTIALVVFLYLRSIFSISQIVDAQTEELLKSRDFFLMLFDNSPVPYMMIEKDATILLPNKAAQRLFGRTAEELREYKFHQLHDENYIAESRQIDAKFTRGVPTQDIELEIVKKNGEKRWVRLSALPLREYGGKSKGGVVSYVDITEQKAIDKVKTEFVSLASHQLRTPLSAMKWYGEMVLSDKEGNLTEKQRRHIEKIYKGNERMIELVNLLLSASRLELGTLTIDIAQTNPIEIAKEIFEELSKQINQKNLHIIESYSGDGNNYYSDKKLLRMIIQNLLSNAVKYTDEQGEVEIRILLSNENMKLTVRDNGLGIPTEEHEKVFSKMFRAQNARLKVTDGTGLGLYIVKEAVKALGGEVGFTSTQNEGTMFTVILPNGTHGSVEKS